MSETQSLRERRAAVVHAHMNAEADQDFAAALATFDRPRYEVVPGNEVHEGDDAVMAFWGETQTAFPDFHFTGTTLHHSDDTVIVETWFVGTHLGTWRDLPATGNTVKYAMSNLFVFEEDRLVCERLYFDRLHILLQLGIAHDPTSLVGAAATLINHPLTVARILRQKLR